jgi:hypothetical protein
VGGIKGHGGKNPSDTELINDRERVVSQKSLLDCLLDDVLNDFCCIYGLENENLKLVRKICCENCFKEKFKKENLKIK